MSSYIAGIGTAVPPHCASQADLAEICKSFSCQTDDHERLLPVLYRRTGVKKRHSVVLKSNDGGLEGRQSFYGAANDAADRGPRTSQRMDVYNREACQLAVQASQNALHESRVSVAEITHLITVSCSGFGAPGFDIGMIEELGMSPQVARTHVGFMGCHGALNALRVARAFTQADPSACVLVCAVELCSLHQQYGWDPDQIVANALFADGAAAVVCMGATRQSVNCWKIEATGSTVVPESQDAMSWQIGDHGFTMTLSPRVPDLIQQQLRPWLDDWLASNRLSIKAVKSWAVHPGGPRILSAFGETAELEREALDVSYQTLADYGNMSSPTVLFILRELREAGAATPCVALGFGPGLAIEATLFSA